MKRFTAIILSIAAVVSLAACSGGEESITTEPTTTDVYQTLEQVIGTSVTDERLVGKILTEPEMDYEKTATAAYDVLTFADGVCSEYRTYYFYATKDDYTAARKNYAEMMLEEPQINSEMSLYFGIISTDDEPDSGLSEMTYKSVSKNWTKYQAREIIK